jgi:hypothetical protein
MCSFWIMTLFPAAPINVFLSFVFPYYGTSSQLDVAIGIAQLLFNVFELVASYYVVVSFIRAQTIEFYRYIDSVNNPTEEGGDAAGPATPSLGAIFQEGLSGIRSLAVGAEPDSAASARRLAGLGNEGKED